MLISCLRRKKGEKGLNINKIRKLAEENYYLSSMLKDFTKYEADENLSDEMRRIYYLAKKIANLGDTIYYEIIKSEY